MAGSTRTGVLPSAKFDAKRPIGLPAPVMLSERRASAVAPVSPANISGLYAIRCAPSPPIAATSAVLVMFSAVR